MRVTRTPRHGVLSRALVTVVMAALIPIPALAAGPGQVAKGQPLTASIARAAAREALRVSPSKAVTARESALSAPVDRSALDHPSFFKTKAGAIALAVVVAGTAVALYSTSHDRIHSTVRK